MFSLLSSLLFPDLCVLDKANSFYDKNYRMFGVALLTRSYAQHALRPLIDSEINHQAMVNHIYPPELQFNKANTSNTRPFFKFISLYF